MTLSVIMKGGKHIIVDKCKKEKHQNIFTIWFVGKQRKKYITIQTKGLCLNEVVYYKR